MADQTVAFSPSAVEGPPFRVTGQAGDGGVVGDLLRSGGAYEAGVTAALRDRLPADGVALDVGANIGVLSLLMGRLCPRGRVIAFEPAPDNLAYLRRNVAENALANVTASAIALYDRTGPLSFVFNEEYPAGSFVGTGAEAQAVDGMRLDDWMADSGLARLDLVKLDVEGAERRVLEGARETFARWRPDLIVEVNPAALRRFQDTSFRDLVAVVRDVCEEIFVIERTGGVRKVLSDDHLVWVLGRDGVTNLLGRGRGRPPLEAGLRARARGWRDLVRLRTTYNRFRPPSTDPPNNFIVEPEVVLAPAVLSLTGPAGGRVELPLTVENRTRWWLSSAFPYHPLMLAYHWLDEEANVVVQDGRRTAFPRPVGPGRRAAVDLTVELPAVPGHYRLAVTVVQEAFAWLDDLEPACRADVEVDVTGTPLAAPR